MVKRIIINSLIIRIIGPTRLHVSRSLFSLHIYACVESFSVETKVPLRGRRLFMSSWGTWYLEKGMKKYTYTRGKLNHHCIFFFYVKEKKKRYLPFGIFSIVVETMDARNVWWLAVKIDNAKTTREKLVVAFNEMHEYRKFQRLLCERKREREKKSVPRFLVMHWNANGGKSDCYSTLIVFIARLCAFSTGCSDKPAFFLCFFFFIYL